MKPPNLYKIEKITNLVELLEFRADSSSSVGFGYYEREAEFSSFAEIAEKARSIASELGKTSEKGTRVLLFYPQGLDYIAAFFGCLYAGLIAVPVYPPRNNRNFERLASIIRNSGAKIALTDREMFPAIKKLIVESGKFESLELIATDEIPQSSSENFRHIKILPEDIAFLQYTSGSTRNPRGVIVSHENLMHNSALMKKAFEYNEQSRCVSWLPMYHDMGLIGSIIQPIYGGYSCALISPAVFLQSPYRWLKLISDFRATISGAPNFGYELCVRKIGDEDLRNLDLSSWKIAFNGAEPISRETIRRFIGKFSVCGFDESALFPCYGLAEATLFVTGGKAGAGIETLPGELLRKEKSDAGLIEKNGADKSDFVSSGLIYDAEQRIRIVKTGENREALENEIGEIRICGKSVAAGYWNDPEETVKVFHAGIAGTDESYLATGDLGLINAGRLYVTGRIKDLIIIRGVNHYPQDIEQTVLGLDEKFQPNSCAAFSINENGEEDLIVVLEIRHPKAFNPAELKRKIGRAIVLAHGIEPREIVLSKSNSIPKTSSGKIQRFRCREKYLQHEFPRFEAAGLGRTATVGANKKNVLLRSFADETETGEFFAELAAWTVQNPRSESENGAGSVKPVFERYYLNGLDSLKSIELMHLFEQHGRKIGFSMIEECTTLAELIAASEQMPEVKDKKPETESGASETPLISSGQKGFWFRHQQYAEYSPDNVSLALRLKGDSDLELLRRALAEIFVRHDVFRLAYAFEADRLEARILPFNSLPFWETTVLTGSVESAREAISHAAQEKFRLGDGALFQARLFVLDETQNILLLKFHHSVIDFWSLRIIVGELRHFYTALAAGNNEELPRAKADYADFALWQQAFVESENGFAALAFWKKKLGGDLPLFSLPFAGKSAGSGHGDSFVFTIGGARKNALDKYCRQHQTTLYIVLLASYFAILYRLTEQPEQIVGAPFAGRADGRWREAVGYFVNPLPLRLRIEAADGFGGLLKKLETEVIEAKKYQDYPFHLLVEKLQPQRINGKSPFFQTMFVFQNRLGDDDLNRLAFGRGSLKIGGVEFEGFELKTLATQFDLSLHISETTDELIGKFEFDTDLFDRRTIESLYGYWSNLIAAALKNPFVPIGFLPITNAQEMTALTSVQRETGKPEFALVQNYFEAQAIRTPDALAVEAGMEVLTYGELNERADRLALVLSANCPEAEKPVGICLPRTANLLIAVLGALKSGAPFVSLDANYPTERLGYIVADSGIETVVTTAEISGGWIEGISNKILIEEIGAETEESGRPSVARTADPKNLAYIIYTSGSTGRPKGVAIEHRSVVAFLEWCRNYFEPDALAATFASTSLNFDLSIFELLAPLTVGGTTVIAENVLFLPETVKKREITLVNTVPSAMAELVKTKALPPNIGTINLAGEALPKSLSDALYDNFAVGRVINLYGPSEDTTYSTVAPITRTDEKITIGWPVDNTKIYLLNKFLQLVPNGYAGEIYLAGKGLARGYFGKPDMTAERFLPDAFATEPGERMYKTGDFGRFLADGNLEYLGRADSQIKIRGFRIELGEIEAVLRSHRAVREAVVIAVEKHREMPQLAAFLVPKAGMKPEFSVLAVKTFARTKLPEFMVPQYFAVLDSLPLTPNGKTDRIRLRQYEFETSGTETAFEPPRTATEIAIAEIWKEVLQLKEVGITNNFFEMGGTSLHLMQIASRLRERCDGDLRLEKLFSVFTIREQARILAVSAGAESSPVETDEIKPVGRSSRRTIILSK